MKIDPDIHIHEIAAKKSSPADRPAESSFADVLNRELENQESLDRNASRVSGLQHTADILLIPPVDEKEAVSRLEKFLDTLEEYAEKLDNPYYTPKDLSFLISRIETESNDLGLLSASLTDNAELKSMIDSALIRSTTEVIRFNRGDYI